MEILAACCPHWEIGKDDFDDHSEAKMGGEPGPTGRANLFDTRKILYAFREKGREGVWISLMRPGKENAGVPVYRSTQRKQRDGNSILLISRITNTIPDMRSVAY